MEKKLQSSPKSNPQERAACRVPPSLTFRVVRFAGILDPEVNIASSSLPGGDAKL